MRKTIRKWFWPWDFDKEEKWLNEMSANGLHLVNVTSYKYTFEEGTPGDYAVRLELLEKNSTSPESKQYIKFVEDTGAEYLGSGAYWAYFRKKKTDGEFELFSDIDSRIKHLNRALFWLGLPSALMLYIVLYGFIYKTDFLKSHLPTLIGYLLCSVLFLFFAYGFLRFYLMKRKLKKERVLHE